MRRATSLALLLLASIALLLAGCGGGKHHASHPQRLAPGQSAPRCDGGDDHTMGQCLPRPPATAAPVGIPAGIACIDLSNNDPVFGVANWRKIASIGVRCAYFKVNESTGFVDQAAPSMISAAKQVGIKVGGYDFQHVCGPSPVAEADVFAHQSWILGLRGSNTMPGVGDVEFRSGSCNAVAWEQAWRAEVKRQLGRDAATYTGAWFWDPNLGSWWPADSIAWISGYNVRWPFMPSGRSHLDKWQYTDTGWNGVTHSDVSAWLDGQQAFNAFANVPAPPPPKHCLAKNFPHTKGCYMVRYGYDRTERDLAKVQSRLRQFHCTAKRHPSFCRGWFWARSVDQRKLADFQRRWA